MFSEICNDMKVHILLALKTHYETLRLYRCLKSNIIIYENIDFHLNPCSNYYYSRFSIT